MYWKVRWEASPVDGEPMRTMVVYKDRIQSFSILWFATCAKHPSSHYIQESQESFKIDPEKKLWTGTFRDSKEFNPEGANPENSLTGTIFTATWLLKS